MIDWDEVFAGAHLTSGPNTHGLTVANFKPSGTGATNIFQDYEPQILAAAKKHGYRILVKNSHHVSFIKNP